MHGVKEHASIPDPSSAFVGSSASCADLRARVHVSDGDRSPELESVPAYEHDIRNNSSVGPSFSDRSTLSNGWELTTSRPSRQSVTSGPVVAGIDSTFLARQTVDTVLESVTESNGAQLYADEGQATSRSDTCSSWGFMPGNLVGASAFTDPSGNAEIVLEEEATRAGVGARDRWPCTCARGEVNYCNFVFLRVRQVLLTTRRQFRHLSNNEVQQHVGCQWIFY